MTKTYPHFVYPKVMLQKTRLYTNLNEEKIKRECERFYDYMIEGGRIKPSSSNYDRHLRGWLAKADADQEVLSKLSEQAIFNYRV